MINRVKSFACCALLLMLAGLSLSGCAASSQPQAARQAVTDSPPAGQGPVSRLAEGRVGFVIGEAQNYDFNQRQLFNLGLDALRSGAYDVAVDCFKPLTEAAPSHSSPYINLAIAYARSGKDELAEKPLKKALDLVAGHPLASHEYGLLLRRAGRFDEARAVYEKALEGFPEYYPLRKNLGVLCDLYVNDRKCAIRQYEKFLEAQPGDEQVELWLAEVKGR